MNFIAFPVGATNIFPLANSAAGGQLLSEFNIRSRESVDTASSVKYFIGKSFVHAPEDFNVYSQRDGYDTTISNTTIQIQPGRALINGHYVELLTPINIDLDDANTLANKEGIASLKGDLAVGLKMAYSTYQTLAGSALVEDEDDYYEGVQVVILPKSAVKLPKDVPGPTEFSQINMHLLLATFSYKNGTISSIKQNTEKIRSVDAERISNIDDIISGTYVSKAKLDPNKLYTFAGKSSNGQTVDGRDTWCDSTDSLMIWDKTPTIDVTRPSSESSFTYDPVTGNTYLIAAHKQVDGMVNTGGQSVYYQDKLIALPNASFSDSTGGVVSPEYTNRIKSLRDKVDNMYWLNWGNCKAYIPVMNKFDDLPPIPIDAGTADESQWWPGDYIVVGEDRYQSTDPGNVSSLDVVSSTGATISRCPSTIYMVRPGFIQSITDQLMPGQSITNVIEVPIAKVGKPDPKTGQIQTQETYNIAIAKMHRTVPDALKGVQIRSIRVQDSSEATQSAVDFQTDHGDPYHDYYVVWYMTETTDIETYHLVFYTPSSVSPNLEYVGPIYITGGVPFATESSTGGFRNIAETEVGSGYVRLDDEGHLRVVDYDLLLTGVLAYQLGEDRSEGSGLTVEKIQSNLEEYVNDRICFPNSNQIQNAQTNGTDPSIINLYLTLPEEGGEITIHDIGSRYAASLFVHIQGEATSATTINFINCDKLRIDPNIEGAPNIVLNKVNLYYDAEVLDKASSINNMTLWYERYSATDPNLSVSGMTVTLVGRIESTETIDPWDSNYANDNHYAYALRSLTFANDGTIVNVGLLVGDSTTANIDEGYSVFATPFTLPQSVGIGYPATKMTHKIKISGTFVSHYYVASENAYMMKSTDFSALTQKYNPLTGNVEVEGTIAFYTNAQLVSHINGVPAGTTVDCWDLNTPHFFTGGVVE